MPCATEQKLLERISSYSARWAGSSWAFIIALAVTFFWIITGPFFNFSNSWQLAMDTLCSVSTFIMVFLLERSQLKNSLAMQIKLNEIIAVLQGANNHLINIEDLSEEEIMLLRKRYQDLASQIQESTPISTHTMITDTILSKSR